MKILAAFAILALVCAEDVEEWTDDNFAENIQSNEIVLVKFYAPWCGHCKRLAPEFEKAATILKANDPPVTLAKVDCTAEGKTSCSKHGVSGYPTLKIFRGDTSNPEDYSGPRETDGIVKYMRGKAGPSSKVITSNAELLQFLEHFEHSIVGYFSDDESALAKKFRNLADSLSEDYRFAHTTSTEVMDEQGQKDTVVIYQPKRLQNKFDAVEAKYEGAANVPDMKKFIQENYHGYAGHRTSGNQGQFKTPLVTVYYEVDYEKNVKGTNYWRNRVMKVSKKMKEAGKEVNFAVSAHQEFGHELSEFGLTFKDKPVVTGKGKSDEKFVMTDEFSVENLEKFVEAMLAGELEPYLKSEAVPEDNSDPVKVVVAKNFDEIVNDETKDVLIEFYAPWCGHCKSLAPKYDELAEKLSGENDIVIAKMDATANDVPKNYEVRGFPTLYFAPKNSKKNPRKYEGGREVKDFIKYLAKESTDPLAGYERSGKKKKSEL